MDCGCNSHSSFLTAKGLAEAVQRRDVVREHVDVGLPWWYLDEVVSVSGLGLGRDLYVHEDVYIDQQYQRFLNGS